MPRGARGSQVLGSSREEGIGPNIGFGQVGGYGVAAAGCQYAYLQEVKRSSKPTLVQGRASCPSEQH